MTYEGMIENIGQWINRTNGEFDAVIAQQIIESQYELEKKFPLWHLIDEYSHPLVAGVTSTRLPNYIIRVLDLEIEDASGFKYPVVFGTKDLLRDRYPAVSANSPSTGRPQVASIKGHIIQFAPQTDATYTLRIWAWHHLDPLDLVTNTSNIWTTIYLSALRYHVLCAMSAFIQDDKRIQIWENKLLECIADLEAEVQQNDNIGTREAMSDVEEVY